MIESRPFPLSAGSGLVFLLNNWSVWLSADAKDLISIVLRR
jgi:hypothetical protein